MTISRINYTGRKKIPLESFTLEFGNSSGPDFKLNADLANLADLRLCADASVSIHGSHRIRRIIFECGTIKEIKDPKVFTSTSNFEGLGFTVKITDVTGTPGKLLAESAVIYPKSHGDKSSKKTILPILQSDLDDEIYRVDFSGDRPVLLINKNAGDKNSIAKSPFFRSLVYPSVLREILTRILIINEYDDPDDDDAGWQAKWLEFGSLMPGMSENPKISEDEFVLIKWIENVVSSFAKYQKCFDLFTNEWSRGRS